MSEIDLKAYLSQLGRSLIQAYSVNPSKVRLSIDSDDIKINIDKANPTGLIINELISNAIKYAFPDERNGRISIKMTVSDSNLEIIVMDDGVGIAESVDWKNTKSLGLMLVRNLVETQLDGSIEMASNNGTKFTIKFNNEV